LKQLTAFIAGLLLAVAGTLSLAGCAIAPASGKPGVLTMALAEDPDALDPTTSSTYVSRIVFIDMCEKLYDIGPKLNVVPQLASALPKVTDGGKTLTIPLRRDARFNDGTPFNAQAVKITLDRYRKLPTSSRAAELSSVESVEVVNPHTVRLHLYAPSAPLLSLLADRAGMILSPTQLHKLGSKFATDPVCVGPFMYGNRVAGDHITLNKSPYYYNRAKVRLSQIIFKIITDGPVRAENLESGDVDAAERLQPFDVVSIKGNPSIHLLNTPSIGYQAITVNTGNVAGTEKPFKPGKVKTPLAQHPALREAFQDALDLNVINKVAFYGQFIPDCGPTSPVSPWFNRSLQCPARNLAQARKLVRHSGLKTPIPVNMIIEASSESERLGEVIQAMEAQAGFAVKLDPTELTTGLDRADKGQFDTFQVGWSGRTDPDGNLYNEQESKGPLNYGGEDNPTVDHLLKQARIVTNPARRRQLYDRVITILNKDRDIIYLYHERLFTGWRSNVHGIRMYGDGLPRLAFASVSG
jgi:peptide/nickel transport system substrate-binding protein